MVRKNVIYTRYSDEKQQSLSLDAQERKSRDGLKRDAIDDVHFLVIKDEAEKGDNLERQGYQKLLAMIANNEVGIVVVDEQSRLSRADNASALIKEIVYQGGRFISVQEGIDTDRKGWEDQVGIHEFTNQAELRHVSWRVRRSLEQRVLQPNGSAGDFPFGYTSEYLDPDEASRNRSRKNHHPKVVKIDPPTALVVRLVFYLFVYRKWSMSAIVKFFNNSANRIPSIGKGKWHAQYIARMLRNEKYIGRWRYGQTTTIKNSQGKKKQIPAKGEW